jgi:sugar (pentulose or hexulose) kinase
MANALGLPKGVAVVAGALDTSCGAVGAGAVDVGIAALASGTWESFVVAASDPDPAALLRASLVTEPHPCVTRTGVFASSPNGTSVIDWVLKLTGVPRRGLDDALQEGDPAPGPLLFIPHLSGATVPWPHALHNTGAVSGLSLSSRGIDLVRSVMEGIACDLAFSVRALQRARVGARGWRVVGGGSRSRWWMQLKADLTGLPVEIVSVSEPGTRGAALLAGLGIGTFASIAEVADLPLQIERRHEPDRDRAQRYLGRLQEHEVAVRDMIRRTAGRGESGATRAPRSRGGGPRGSVRGRAPARPRPSG